MTPLYAFFIYLLIWWIVIFAVLPIGVERNTEEGRGYDTGAPRITNLKAKLVWATLISAVILAIMWLLVDMNVIRWHEWFDGSGFDT
jgi:predicted secreted protein